MKPSLYTSAMEGNVAELGQHKDVLEGELTPNRNNILHVAVQFSHVDYVEHVLEACPSLLRCPRNVKGETPLHIAARDGNAEIVKAMIARAKRLEEEVESGWGGAVKEMLRATNVEGDTALHMAARYCHLEAGEYLDVVKLLANEDPEFEHPPNNIGETPLYLAAERGSKGVAVVDTLIKTCTSPTYSGPGGRTALHAAALADSTGQSTQKLLEWNKNLINQEDAYGWTPLHYGTWNNNFQAVEELLKIDISVASTTTKDNVDTGHHIASRNESREGVKEVLAMDESGVSNNTTSIDNKAISLHIAAAHGHVQVLEKLLSYNPNCWEIVNIKGQNILHIAVDMNNNSLIEFIVNQSWVRHLINQKDNDGNTPLHLLTASDCGVSQLWKHERADRHAFNGENMTPIDLVWSSLKEERMSTFATTHILDDTFLDSVITCGRNIACNARDDLAKLERARTQEKYNKQQRKDEERESQEKAKVQERKELSAEARASSGFLMIVASLIATISFAAAFAIPGGYDGNKGPDQGIAVLARAAAFRAFLITNTIAMVCSVTSMFLCITAMSYAWEENEEHLTNRTVAVLILLFVSMFAMMLAFIAATFAVLAHSIALAVSVCIIACTTFIVYFFEIVKIYSSED